MTDQMWLLLICMADIVRGTPCEGSHQHNSLAYANATTHHVIRAFLM